MFKLTKKPLHSHVQGNILSFFKTNNSHTPRPVLNRYVNIWNDPKIFAVHVYKQPSAKHTLTTTTTKKRQKKGGNV